MAQKIINDNFFISVDIDNYHNKCQIIIPFKFKKSDFGSKKKGAINFP